MVGHVDDHVCPWVGMGGWAKWWSVEGWSSRFRVFWPLLFPSPFLVLSFSFPPCFLLVSVVFPPRFLRVSSCSSLFPSRFLLVSFWFPRPFLLVSFMCNPQSLKVGPEQGLGQLSGLLPVSALFPSRFLLFPSRSLLQSRTSMGITIKLPC